MPSDRTIAETIIPMKQRRTSRSSGTTSVSNRLRQRCVNETREIGKAAGDEEVPRPQVGGSVVWGDDQNRARCQADHSLAGCPKDEVGDRAMTAGTGDDEVGVALARYCGDGF